MSKFQDELEVRPKIGKVARRKVIASLERCMDLWKVPSIQAYQTFMICLHKWYSLSYRTTRKPVVTFTYDEFMKLNGITAESDEPKAKSEAIGACLWEAKKYIVAAERNYTVSLLNLFSRFLIDPNSQTVEVEFTETAAERACGDSPYFTAIPHELAMKFSCVGSMRLYEVGHQMLVSGHKTLVFDILPELACLLFQAPAPKDWRHFAEQYLDPFVNEVNSLTSIQVSYEFAWDKKTGDVVGIALHVIAKPFSLSF